MDKTGKRVAPSIIRPDELTAEEDRIFGKTHQMETDLLQARLRGWFEVEAGPVCWVTMLLSNGTWFDWSKSGGDPMQDKRAYARRIVAFLNKELHHGGAWVGGWLDTGFSRFYLLWKDPDGDIQFPLDTPPELRWRELARWTPEDWGKHAAEAHQAWSIAMQVVDAQEGQVRMLAKETAGLRG